MNNPIAVVAARQPHNTETLDAALQYYAAGYSLLPIGNRGMYRKRPQGRWKHYQTRRAPLSRLNFWYDRERPFGIGLVCGAISRLELYDFDHDAARVFAESMHDLQDIDLAGIAVRVNTPSDGIHLWTLPDRSIIIPGNEILASEIIGPGKRRKFIETRGEGGMALAPGCSAECHPRGGIYRGSVEALANLRPMSAEIRDRLRTAFRKHDRAPAATTRTTVDFADSPTPRRTSATAASLSRFDIEARAVAYLDKCDPAISDHGGHNTTIAVARAIVLGFNLGADAGFDILAKFYNPRCSPPWSDAELLHKCQDADVDATFEKRRGWLLDEELPARNTKRSPNQSRRVSNEQPPKALEEMRHVSAEDKKKRHKKIARAFPRLASAFRLGLLRLSGRATNRGHVRFRRRRTQTFDARLASPATGNAHAVSVGHPGPMVPFRRREEAGSCCLQGGDPARDHASVRMLRKTDLDFTDVTGPPLAAGAAVPDASPAPSPLLAPTFARDFSRYKFCRHCSRVFKYHPVHIESMFQRFPCKRLSCEDCHPIVVDHWKATFGYRLAEWESGERQRQGDAAEASPRLYAYRIDTEQEWNTAARNIRDRGGDYYGIDIWGTYCVHAVSSVLPASVRRRGPSHWRELSVDDARKHLHNLIDQLPHRGGYKPVHRSKAWKLIEVKKADDKGWIQLGLVKAEQQEIERVCRKWGVPLNASRHVRGGSVFSPWDGQVIHLPRTWTEAVARLFYDDLTIGGVEPPLSSMESELGLEESGGLAADGLAAASTGCQFVVRMGGGASRREELIEMTAAKLSE